MYTTPQYPEDDTIRAEWERCVARCVLKSDCETLQNLWCDQGLSQADPLATCVGACPIAPEDGFECRDGTRIPHSFLCDGNSDCGKDDELNCTFYVCADGQGIRNKDLKCDNTLDCNDGSDEEACPLSCEG